MRSISERLKPAGGRHPSVAFVSTYPPTECGIATFTQDLRRAIERTRRLPASQVIAIDPGSCVPDYRDQVLLQIRQDSLTDYLAAADYLNCSSIDVVSLQHEYGIFGGEDGEYAVDFLEALSKPAVVTCHTVLPSPSPEHRRILGSICHRAEAVVVMNSIASWLLANEYGVPLPKVHLIHHGVPRFNPKLAPKIKRLLGMGDRILVSTFGLISPGKGIEYAIEAMPAVVERHPEAIYLILGATHPGVVRREGERYRCMLENLIGQLGIEANVRFENRYLTKEELVNYLTATDIYLTPYLNPHQIVSGALAYAVGAGKPVISTPYLYAFELLRNGRGMIVDFRAPADIAHCINILIEDPALRRRLADRAYGLGSRMIWEQVAKEYADLFVSLVREERGLPAPIPVAPLAMAGKEV